MKLLSCSVHGIIDYITVGVFLLAPLFGEFAPLPGGIAISLAFIHFLLTMLTNFEYGLLEIVPFPLHGWIEKIVGPTLVALPFLLNFETRSRYFFVIMGIVIGFVTVITDYTGPEGEKG